MTTPQRSRTEQQLTARAAELLDAHADALPDADVKALAAARRRALDTMPAPRPTIWWAVPAGATAALVVAALFWFDPPPLETPLLDPGFQPVALEDPELLEELEFLAWSIEEDETRAL
ncbi:MAG TPA: hypothetical protein VLT59_12920 [Steroidobacteraceae bacterium]|nr:hypothetical protein [Steroidobacteraceae bacterium]